MSHFCLLRDAENYVAQDYDLVQDTESRTYWLDLFEKHFADALRHAETQYGSVAQIEQARSDFTGTLQRLREEPGAFDGHLSVLDLCRLREKALRENGLHDPYGHIKDRENATAAKLYPQMVRELHAMSGDDKWLHLVQRVFAGNIFDLGSPATMNLAEESPDFLQAVENVKPRPWLVDDFDRLLEDLPEAPPTKWSKAVVFVDNAGPDFILGVMPLVRELAIYGTQVVLAANELPSLNDITVDEMIEVVTGIAKDDPDLEALVQAQMFEAVSTGGDTPLVDLSEVTDELNDAAADADLVVLEGMGRAVESNFDVRFTVDTLKLALLKDPNVAAHVGGEVYDCVCKYEPA
jgi:uncharacterized protein with ATP-grasp and redox domains